MKSLQSAKNERLRCALNYANRGWAVLPCRAGDKTPATPHGYKDATTDAAEIARLWRQNPSANVAIATGCVSRLLVLDVDPRNGGDESLAELERAHGELPATTVVDTGGGGRHYYFSLPEDSRVSCSVLMDGLDLKADGGYVVAPPSVHPSRGVYSWRSGICDQPVAPAPSWLLRLASKKPPRSKKPRVGGPDAADTPLGRLFAELSLLGSPRDGGKRIVVCPWQSEHTTGQAFDSSTVIFPASEPSGLGVFHCSHSHCKQRTSADAFRELSRRRDAGAADAEWLRSLTRNRAGQIVSSFRNVCLIVENDGGYGSRLRFDEMRGVVLHADNEVTDEFVSQVRIDLEERYAVRGSEPDTVRAVNYVAAKRKFHPVREYLSGLIWDGNRRLDRVASEILRVRAGTPDELGLVALMLKRWFVGLVGRPMKPGLKVDNTLIVQGLQGTGKSTFFRVIAGPWFSDSDMSLDKDGMMQIAGAWISEWAELETVMGRHSMSKVKAFLTSPCDRFRPPFGRNMVTLQRSGVIVGSTNLQDFLSDPTGHRRFWAVPAGEVNLKLLEEWREQLLAEAVCLFRQGERHWFDNAEEARRAEFVSQFTDADPWDEPVLRYARGREHVRAVEVLAAALNIPPERQARRDQYRVTNILRRAGFDPQQRRISGEKQRVWVPPLSPGTGATGATP